MKISYTVFNLQSRHKYLVEMAMFNVQRAVTPKLGIPGVTIHEFCTLMSFKFLWLVSSKYLEPFLTYRADTATFNIYVVQRAVTPKEG